MIFFPATPNMPHHLSVRDLRVNLLTLLLLQLILFHNCHFFNADEYYAGVADEAVLLWYRHWSWYWRNIWADVKERYQQVNITWDVSQPGFTNSETFSPSNYLLKKRHCSVLTTHNRIQRRLCVQLNCTIDISIRFFKKLGFVCICAEYYKSTWFNS